MRGFRLNGGAARGGGGRGERCRPRAPRALRRRAMPAAPTRSCAWRPTPAPPAPPPRRAGARRVAPGRFSVGKELACRRLPPSSPNLPLASTPTPGTAPARHTREEAPHVLPRLRVGEVHAAEAQPERGPLSRTKRTPAAARRAASSRASAALAAPGPAADAHGGGVAPPRRGVTPDRRTRVAGRARREGGTGSLRFVARARSKSGWRACPRSRRARQRRVGAAACGRYSAPENVPRPSVRTSTTPACTTKRRSSALASGTCRRRRADASTPRRKRSSIPPARGTGRTAREAELRWAAAPVRRDASSAARRRSARRPRRRDARGPEAQSPHREVGGALPQLLRQPRLAASSEGTA